MPGPSLRDQFPLRLIIGQDDCTFLLDNGFTFSNVDPGGFEAASFSVPRDLPQTIRGQYVRLDCGLRVAFEGRVQQVQRSLGARTSIICEGYGALLKDLTRSQIFIDRDLTHWQQWSITRQKNDAASFNTSQFSWQIGADSTNLLPGLIIQAQGQLVGKPIIEAWYDAGPNNLIARVRINSGNALGYTFPDALNLLSIFTCDDDTAANSHSSGSFAAASPSQDFTSPAQQRYALIQHLYNSAAAAKSGGVTYGYSLQNLSVIGNHGLTLRGSAPTDGFYPSDVVTWIEQQIPGLQAGIIQQTDASGYILPHSVYYTPVGLDTIMNDMAIAQGWHWGAWESLAPLTGNSTPRVDFRPRAQAGAPTAFCRRQDCDQLDIREDLTQQFNKAVVTYTDTAGRPGAVTVTVDNPILDQAGIAERDVEFSGGTMTAATATVFGAEALLILNAQQRVAGSADIISPIDQGGPAPAFLLKSGIDRLRIGDLPSTDAFGAMNDLPISRVECSGSETGLNTSVEFGSGASLIETLQARLASATARAGQGA